MTGDVRTDQRIAIGPSCVRSHERAMSLPLDGILTAPLGIERLLARRLRAWVLRDGTCPARVISYGSQVGDLAGRALVDVDRVMHRDPPSDAMMQCARTALAGWREFTVSRRAALREELGIRPESLVILAGGDRAQSIDFRAAFDATSQAILAGSDFVLIAPQNSRWASETVRYVARVGMSDRVRLIDDAEIPHQLWQVVDVMLLHAPSGVAGNRSWWGWSAWWARAAGIPVIHESCAHDCEGSLRFDVGDRSGCVRALLEFGDHSDVREELSAAALRSAHRASRGESPHGSVNPSECATQVSI